MLRISVLVLVLFGFQNHYDPVCHSDLFPRCTGSRRQGYMHYVMSHMQHRLLSFHEGFQ